VRPWSGNDVPGLHNGGIIAGTALANAHVVNVALVHRLRTAAVGNVGIKGLNPRNCRRRVCAECRILLVLPWHSRVQARGAGECVLLNGNGGASVNGGRGHAGGVVVGRSWSLGRACHKLVVLLGLSGSHHASVRCWSSLEHRYRTSLLRIGLHQRSHAASKGPGCTWFGENKRQ
jgi:hypothetical protein